MRISRFDILKASIKKYKTKSIFVKNFLIVMLLIMIPLDIVSLLFYANINKSMRHEIYQSNYNYTYTIHNITDNIMKEMQSLAIIAASQNDILNYLISEPQPGLTNSAQDDVSRYCKNFSYTHKYINSIYIYCESTNTILSDYMVRDFSNYKDNNWYKEYASTKTDETKIIMRAKNDYYPYFLTIIRPVFVTDINRMGAVIINVNIQELAEIFSNLDLPTDQKIYIVDNGGKIIYSENQNEILCNSDSVPLISAINTSEKEDNFSYTVNGTTYTYSSINSKLFPWKYVSAVPMSFYMDRTASVSLLLFTLLAVSLVIGAVVSFYISTRTYRPIGNIMELISSPEGNAQLYTDAPKNESSYILSRISNTLQKNRELQEELDIRITLLKHAQIVMLQSQINPHFLFNTLDTINWMAIDGFDGENEVSDALTTLGDLFKLNIDTANYLTDLKSEMEYTKKYIEILALRHKDIFTVNWTVDDALHNCKVPRLILQPLIENAIYHGIKPKRTPGTIQVNISADENYLTIKVSDDGIGMERTLLENLSREFEQDYVFGGKHVGLKNINQRIKLIYGNEYGVKITSASGMTTVHLKMPNVE